MSIALLCTSWSTFWCTIVVDVCLLSMLCCVTPCLSASCPSILRCSRDTSRSPTKACSAIAARFAASCCAVPNRMSSARCSAAIPSICWRFKSFNPDRCCCNDVCCCLWCAIISWTMSTSVRCVPASRVASLISNSSLLCWARCSSLASSSSW